MSRLSDLVERMKEVDVGEYPDVHQLDDLGVALWVLLVAWEKLGETLSADEVAVASTRVCRRALSRQMAAHVLDGARGLVAVVRGSRAPRRYEVLRLGEEKIRASKAEAIIVDPARPFEAVQALERLLNSITGQVDICDPYVCGKTLIALAEIPPSRPIRLLTQSISDPPAFRRKLQAYSRQFGNLDLRLPAVPDLHDRYLIDGDRMWWLGQSLNGIGKKHSLIVPVGPDLRIPTAQFFAQRWATASKWN